MKKLPLFIVLCIAHNTASATLQIPESIVIGTDTLYMKTMPLDMLPAKLSQEFQERVQEANKGNICTALWRGYQGLWELRNDTLRLLSVYDTNATLDRKSGGRISMEGICAPGGYADWFSGDMLVVSRRNLGQAPANCFEHEAIYTLRNGVVAGKQAYRNHMIGSRAAFEKAMSGLANSLHIPDPGPRLSIHAFFSYTPNAKGLFEGFDHVKLVFRTSDGEQVIEDAFDHPYLQELTRRLREIEPYGVCRRGQMQPVSWGLPLWRRMPQKE